MGALRLSVIPSSDDGLCGPGGYGDLGYCEVDRAASAGFIHRMLFSSVVVLTVKFEGFGREQKRFAKQGVAADGEGM